MSWNGSQNAGQPASSTTTTTSNYNSSPHRSSTSTSNFNYKRAALVALALAALGGAALWFFTRPAPAPAPAPQPKAPPKPAAVIEEQRPAETPKPKTPVKHVGTWSPKKTPKLTAKTERPKLVAKDVIDYGTITSTQFYGRKLFKSWTDNFVSGILMATPGDKFIGLPIDKRFDEDFKKSLDDKIEILPEDTEDDIAVKNAVIAAKQQLKECLDRGESPREVVQAVYDDMMKICEYREQLEDNLRLIVHDEGGTLEDAQRYVEESNELLKEYNARPISLNPKTERKLMRRDAERKGNTNE